MQELFRKYLDNQCSPKEVNELFLHFNNPENEVTLRALIVDSLANIDADDDESQWQVATDNLFAPIKKQIRDGGGNVVPFFKKNWVRLVAAAILLGGGFSIYRYMNGAGVHEQQIAKTDTVNYQIRPGGNKAMLTLDNGSIIDLSTALKDTIAKQGNTNLFKMADGQISYKLLNEKPTQVMYNSVTTPKGGQYQLILSDGTVAWMNAASSIHFPVAFTGSERNVEVTGEVYFEVATLRLRSGAKMPFKVKVADKAEIEVLGTHFDVNAYTDEATINTTLLEGRVKITDLMRNDSRIITPGEQAQFNATDKIKVNKLKNAEEVVAWKNGTFNFDNADLQMALRQLARWYDVDIIFEDSIPQKKFTGEIQRSLNLSQVITLLEKNGVHCRIEEKKLIVEK